MDQHALVMARESLRLTRSDEDSEPITSIAPSTQSPSRVLLTLTLDSAQVSALVSAAGVETVPVSETASRHHHDSTITSRRTSHLSTSATNSQATSFATTRAVVRIANTPNAIESPFRTVQGSASLQSQEPAALPTQTDVSQPASVSTPSNSAGGASGAFTTITRTIGSSGSSGSHSSSNGSSSGTTSNTRTSSSSTPSSTAVRSVTTTVTSTMTTSSRSYTSTRLFSTTVVVKPVITDAANASETASTDAQGADTNSPETVTSVTSVMGTSTARPESSFKSFLSSIDSSPTAIALTAIIFAGIAALIALGIFLCLRRRSRRAKRRASLLEGEADAKTITSLYSEKDSLYPFYAPMKTPEDADSQLVEAPSSIAPTSPKTANAGDGTATGVRFAGIYPTLPPLRRKSVMDLPATRDLTEAVDPTDSSVPTFRVDDRYASANPFADPVAAPSSSQEGQASIVGLQIPKRPVRPASLTNSFKREIDEALRPSPQPSVDSFLPAPPQPWIRPARRWASMSSAAGSHDRRFFQQQMPSRFSITTLGTSGQPSPDLGNYRPRRTAITGQNIVESMLRTDIFEGTNEINSTGDERVVNPNQNPFSDSAQILPKSVPILGEGMSPTCSNLPWSSGRARPTEDPSLAQGITADEIEMSEDDEADGVDQDDTEQESVSDDSESTTRTAVEPPVQEQHSSSNSSLEGGNGERQGDDDEEEEARLRAMIRRRQSASEGL